MGAHEDFMAMRRAAAMMADGTKPVETAITALLRKAAAKEISFIRLAKAGVQNELINLAWAVIGEPRPGGPAGAQDEEVPGV